MSTPSSCSETDSPSPERSKSYTCVLDWSDGTVKSKWTPEKKLLFVGDKVTFQSPTAPVELHFLYASPFEDAGGAKDYLIEEGGSKELTLKRACFACKFEAPNKKTLESNFPTKIMNPDPQPHTCVLRSAGDEITAEWIPGNSVFGVGDTVTFVSPDSDITLNFPAGSGFEDAHQPTTYEIKKGMAITRTVKRSSYEYHCRPNGIVIDGSGDDVPTSSGPN